MLINWTASEYHELYDTISQRPLTMVKCPICDKNVKSKDINAHIDSGCESFLDTGSPPLTQQNAPPSQKPPASQKAAVSTFFQTPAAKKSVAYLTQKVDASPTLRVQPQPDSNGTPAPNPLPRKRSHEDIAPVIKNEAELNDKAEEQPAKKHKTNAFQKAARKYFL